MTLVQLAAGVAIFVGFLSIGGMMYHGIKRIANIELQVMNHIPTQLAKLESRQEDIKDRLISHEATEGVYFRMVEQLMNEQRNGQIRADV